MGQDEKEKNIRALLNLGHTFGHAIENNLGYGKWLHGEAIACGFLIAADISIQKKTMAIAEYEEIKKILKIFKLTIKLPKNINLEKIYKTMLLDKKVKNNKIVFILPKNMGSAYINSAMRKSMVMKALKNHAQ